MFNIGLLNLSESLKYLPLDRTYRLKGETLPVADLCVSLFCKCNHEVWTGSRLINRRNVTFLTLLWSGAPGRSSLFGHFMCQGNRLQ